MTRTGILGATFFVLLASAALAQEGTSPRPPKDWQPPQKVSTNKPSVKSRIYIGGWLGASSGGNVDRFDAAPEIGFRFNDRFHLGASVVYRYRKDKRFEPDLSTSDVGGSLFGRYFVYQPFYLQAGVEQLSWEFIGQGPAGPATFNADHTSVLIGPGLALPIGPRAATYMSILYDVNYDSKGPNPYDNPWVFRIGFGVSL